MIAVRPAGRGDARVLAEMRYAFRSEMAAPAEPAAAFIERATRWLADRLERGAWTAWVAAAGEQPVGLVLVQMVEKVPNPVREPESLGYVSSLYVRPPWRGQGTGGRLLATALEFCRLGGVDTVVLWPSPRSIPLYARHGFRSRGEVMELRESSPELRPEARPLSPGLARRTNKLCR